VPLEKNAGTLECNQIVSGKEKKQMKNLPVVAHCLEEGKTGGKERIYHSPSSVLLHWGLQSFRKFRLSQHMSPAEPHRADLQVRGV
jgi:hypothetical protein